MIQSSVWLTTPSHTSWPRAPQETSVSVCVCVCVCVCVFVCARVFVTNEDINLYTDTGMTGITR